MMNQDNKYVTRDEFKQAMLTYMSKGRYPLEHISMLANEDDSGRFIFVTITDYVTGQTLFTGSKEGFPTRAAALSFVGEIWDEFDEQGIKFKPRLTVEEAKTHN